MKKLELLSPAKNLECGIAAINCGADAVYIGAPKFGARAVAGNDIKDIETLILYAHKYWAKVYVTLNTIIYDNELAEVQTLINELNDLGTDAIIIQDTGILELDLPPIPLFASTQMHNNTLEKVQFLQEIGIQRIILPRELSLPEIFEIRKNTTIELESFVHGALCVSYSGQCYFSQALFQRSGNRGECAQSCRMFYSLEDSKGKVLIKDKYLLSLKDLNLSSYLEELVEAGITSFKIEGRLKDLNYVKNITSYYRQELDRIIEKDNLLTKASSGKTSFPFTPDPDRTFNRGYTDYFIKGRHSDLASLDTQKSLGKYIGDVEEISGKYFTIKGNEKLNNGDGICYFDKSGTLCGMNITRVDNNKNFVQDVSGIYNKAKIYRNRENEFNKELDKKGLKRQIDVIFTLYELNDEMYFSCEDEDGNKAELKLGSLQIAENQTTAEELMIRQLSKSGETVFNVKEVKFKSTWKYFLAISKINEIRRDVLSELEKVRYRNYPRIFSRLEENNYPYPVKLLDHRWNIVNKNAVVFYKRHGAEIKEDGFEKLDTITGKTIMKCKYCIKDQLNMCPKKNSAQQKNEYEEPLYLSDNKRKYMLKFDCKKCEMEIVIF